MRRTYSGIGHSVMSHTQSLVELPGVPGDSSPCTPGIEGTIILVEGVPEGYDPSATAKAVREAAGGGE